jgi:hypothetical protein
MNRKSAEKEWRRGATRLFGRVSTPASRRAAKLVDQQFWLWGRDVMHDEGNGLIRAGFVKLPAPEGRPGCSCYEWNDGKSLLRLWGFGLIYARNDHAIVLPREVFGPCLVRDDWAASVGWTIEDLPRHSAPDDDEDRLCRDLMIDLCTVVEQHERWVTRTYRDGAREAALAAWKKRCTVGANVAADWAALRQSLSLDDATLTAA